MHIDADRVAEVCRRHGVVELAIFGSLARGQQTAESDVDLLYVLNPEVRIGWEIHRLEDELSAVFGRPVDLVAKDVLHRLMRDEVLREAEIIYAA